MSTEKNKAAVAIYQDTQAIRSDIQELKPLLDLLETPEGDETSDPIEEIKQLLEQIVLGQQHLMNAINDNTAHVIALRQGRMMRAKDGSETRSPKDGSGSD
ncbi:hypothetical protein LAL4801_06166 [Roseibium aggregatum]|uniref:Uncharacterized protein n=1 Tax=Roseibium aggregatum TaxID=187304 RepID=A0A0M6YDC2_9HYPH|nr:hypothetical protein LAL4801_06166 [Roseibium aggregatum]